jgi:hypothetical protein
MTRRALLKSCGVGAMSVLVAGVGVGSYRVYANGVLDSGDGAPYEPWLHWREDASPLGMVASAILAANPHNSQSWLFAVTPTTMDVYADLTRRTGALDPLGIEQMVGTVAKLAPASSREAGDAFWLDQTLTLHTRTAAAYGVISVADTTAPIQRLTGGRLLQRIHLAATSEGIALQHMNQITERIDREVALAAKATFGHRLHALLAPSEGSVLSTFRVGYPARDALLSPRRPVSAVTR